MPNPTAQLPTIGTIAARLAQPIHRVEYAVKALGISACARAGGLRVFSDDDVARIACHLSPRPGRLAPAAAQAQQNRGES